MMSPYSAEDMLFLCRTTRLLFRSAGSCMPGSQGHGLIQEPYTDHGLKLQSQESDSSTVTKVLPWLSTAGAQTAPTVRPQGPPATMRDATHFIFNAGEVGE